MKGVWETGGPSCRGPPQETLPGVMPLGDEELGFLIHHLLSLSGSFCSPAGQCLPVQDSLVACVGTA